MIIVLTIFTGFNIVSPLFLDRDSLLTAAGHLVNITMAFLAPGKAVRGNKIAMKPARITKMDHIVITSRTDFITAFLAVHELAEQFSPGVHSGPVFKLWWTGSR